MKEPAGTRYVPGYDLFKLLVAIALTVILILLLLRESQRRSALLETVLPTMTSEFLATVTSTSTSTPETPAVTPTEVTETAPAETPTETETTETPPDESESTETSEADDCPSNPTRIRVGDTVKVLSWLHFRVGAGLYFPIQHTNKPGTEMEVIGGPVCTVRADDPPRAYLWWNVRMEDGREGWSAEAPLNFPNYFLEPID